MLEFIFGGAAVWLYLKHGKDAVKKYKALMLEYAAKDPEALKELKKIIDKAEADARKEHE